MATLQVMTDMETFMKSLAFEYLDNIRDSYRKMLEVIKQLPTSEELNSGNEKCEMDGSLAEYVKVYFGVAPGDENAMRFQLHDIYYKKYEERNNILEEQLEKRRKIALVNLQEQMNEIKETMITNGDYTVPDPWRLEDEVYYENKKEKAKLTCDILDLPQASYLKEWKQDDSIPLAVTNRWELLTYHLNSIAKANRNYGNHSRSYWNNERLKMRNDKDFIVSLNILGLTMTTLMKCYGLVDSSNAEDMYFLNIFKDAMVYHLM